MTATEKLRKAMLDRVREQTPVGDAVAAAMLAVPRHLFLPGSPPEEAYLDQPIVTRRDATGAPTSSSSQPTIMAIMLDQLGVRPGDRVLEIGAGTGYNAALLAELAGPEGSVVSVDIDPGLVASAHRHLGEAGHGGVQVVCGDGAEGYAPGAPYDRIIATVGVWDLAPAWPAQLAPEGRIVVPLDLNGVQRSVALEREGEILRSVSMAYCGFMRMRGTLAGPELTVVLDPGTGLTIFLPGATDIGDVPGALAAPAAAVDTGLRAGRAELYDGLCLWLAAREPRWCGLSEKPGVRLPPSPLGADGVAFTVGVVAGGSLALLAAGASSLVVHGYGQAGARLAADLAGHVAAWDAAGRPLTGGLRVEVYPRPVPPPPGAVIEKRHTVISLCHFS